MKNIKVTWHDGPWNPGETQPTASVEVPSPGLRLASVGEETLVFMHASAGTVYLAIPSSRLISAVEVDGGDA